MLDLFFLQHLIVLVLRRCTCKGFQSTDGQHVLVNQANKHAPQITTPIQEYEGTVWDDLVHGKGVYIAEEGIIRLAVVCKCHILISRCIAQETSSPRLLIGR